MSNMSYCRFHNTLGDLQDCKDALEEYEDKLHERRQVAEAKKTIEHFESLERGDHDGKPDAIEQKYLDAIDYVDEHEEDGISESERGCARSLIILCKEIVDEFDDIDLT